MISFESFALFDYSMSFVKPKLNLFELIVAFLLPTLFGKSLILYFALNYSNYPEEGYGYGLAASIAFTLAMAGRFILKYKNYQND